MRHSLTEQDARRLLGGAPVVLVTTRWHGTSNIMPVAWSMPLSIDPPLVGIAVHPSRHTHDMIRFSEEFALNLPSRELLNHVQYFGVLSGREIQKIEASKVPTFSARKVEAPLLEGCVGYIECGLEDALRIGDHTLFVGRVVAVSAEKEAFDDTWLLEDDDEKPLHYLGLDYYAIMGNRLQAVLKTTESGGLNTEEYDEETERRESQENAEQEKRTEEASS